MIALAEALRDPVYRTPENYVGRNGFACILQWSRFKAVPNVRVPDAPDRAMNGF